MMGFQEAWGWPAALYLFLGGLGAGTFIVASLVLLTRKQRQEPAVAAAYWFATACLAGGLLALVFELGQPERGVLLWRSFANASSWMTLGAWALALSLAMFLVAALLATASVSDALSRRWEWFARAGDRVRFGVAIGGSALALFVAFYTGLLLKGATGVPFWSTWLLPALFAVSALAAGANAFALLSVLTGCARQADDGERRRFVLAAMCLSALEATLLLAYLMIMLDGGPGGSSAARAAACAASARALISGELSLEFWALVVVTGLVASLAFSAASCVARGNAGLVVLAAGSACALSGECALRFLVLLAGVRVDYIAAVLLGVI